MEMLCIARAQDSGDQAGMRRAHVSLTCGFAVSPIQPSRRGYELNSASAAGTLGCVADDEECTVLHASSRDQGTP